MAPTRAIRQNRPTVLAGGAAPLSDRMPAPPPDAPPPRWRFRRMYPGEMNVDPIEAEFFSTEALGSLADALVRETIQNSLDARRPGERLRMRFAFSGRGSALAAESGAGYLAGLRAHVVAGLGAAASLPPDDAPLDYLVVEDFGTRGLQGDPRRNEDDEIGAAGERNDFYYFWRNVGRSRKGPSELGRWGLGKTVFAAASRLFAFLALTIPANAPRPALMGQAVLRIHKLAGVRHYPYGYFAEFDGDFALPVDTPAVVDRFRADFALARGAEPGLSVVIPYPAAELAPEPLLRSVLRHYFVPILAGDLEVEIEHDGRRETVTAATFGRVVARVARADASSLPRTVELARWGLALAPDAAVQLPVPGPVGAPRWTGENDAAAALAALREPFGRGERVAVRVPLWVKPLGAEPTGAAFEVWLERDDAIVAADEQFVRDGITVAGVRGGCPNGVRAIVCVRDRALSALLGDSENPAHTEWQERSPRFKDRYRHGPSTLRYVKSAPRELVRLLTRPVAGRDFALLRHLFSLGVPDEESVRQADPRRRREAADGDGESSAEPAPGAARTFELARLPDGFSIAGVARDTPGPRFLAVRVAYEVRRGNPFTLYQPLDFDLAQPPIALTAEGASFVRRAGNELVLRIEDRRFRLAVRGFDPRRDVRVRAIPLDEEPGG